MFNQFKNINSNINTKFNKDFIWVAEYLNGNILCEFEDINTENNFYDIDKSQLLRFGLIGHNFKLYFETINGSFYLNNKKIDIVYKDENNIEYNLSNNNAFYNDIIEFKRCSLIMNLKTQKTQVNTNKIESYNFGYKQKLNINGVNFNFKFVITIPYNKPMRMNIRVVSDKSMNGTLIIRKNNYKDIKYYAPIKANKGGEIDWVVI